MMGIKPQDLLADHEDTKNIGGITIRKATFAAAIANVNIFESKYTSAAEKNDALQTITELAPALIAIGLHKHLAWKNPEIQKIFEEIAMSGAPYVLL